MLMGINDMKSKQHSSLKSSHPKLMHMFKALLQVLILESWSFIYMLLEKIDKLPYEDMTPFQATVVVVQKIDWIYMGLTLLVLKEKERAWLAGDHVSVHIFFMGHVTCHVRLYNF
ncbi:uncharacterized protein [Zea mays]|uniref:uncharacterized protein isoform X1 n=1 Tax=Zea mays TaxID=4577 RepID=UPI0009AA46EF|nr:uncharacterized protein LOC103626155 isoform X1 [Zea mays]|eukprot:XP_020393223.1 uncharacterized protein LOC103626155 [Zea mays]